MFVYHIDRSTNLQTGMKISINSNFKPNNKSGTNLLYTLNLSGVSYHGEQYLNDKVYSSKTNADLNDLTASNILCSMSITEYTFELIRQINHPNMPSRFSSFFALEKLEDLAFWPELTKEPYKIFEIEVFNNPPKLDASFLRGGIALGFNSESSFYQGFSPSINSHLANQYWSGLFSDNPKPELLLSLPLTIGKEIII